VRSGSYWLIVIVHVGLLACSGTEKAGAPDTAGGATLQGASISSGGYTRTATAPSSGGAQPSGGATSVSGILTGGTSSVNSSNAASGGAGTCVGTPALGAVTPADLFAELQRTSRAFLLIDVRNAPVESIPGTDTNIMYTFISALETYIGPDTSCPVVLYCQTGHTSTIAGDALVRAGYCNVRVLTGGIDAWQAAGYPVQ
jgi:rhodanese-related sulfurtransferase